MSMDLEVLEIPISRKVLVSGAGVVACTAALELSKAGYDVILSSPEPDIRGHGQLIWGGEDHPPTLIESMTHDIEGAPGIEIVTSADILACEGSTGQFTIKIKAGNKTILKEVGAVILANEPECVADFGAWRLEESERIRSLSWLEKALDSSADHPLVSGEKPNRIVLLSGFIHQANPFSQKRAIDSALKLAANQTNQIFFLTEHFKVAHQGMERLTRKAREAGVLFVKLTDMRPEIRAEGDRVEIFYYDEGMESEISLYPDYIILEEAYRPPKENARFEERFGFNLDPTQKETVYNRPIYTTRSGIWVTGPAKGPLSMEEGIEEAKAVALEVHRFLGTGSQVSAERRLLFNDSRCGRCLTCYRLCPHRAISPSQGRPTFFDLSCKACGICAAGCPADAIQIASFTDDDLNSQIVNALANPREIKAPNLIAFCCENSAFEAARLADEERQPRPAHCVEYSHRIVEGRRHWFRADDVLARVQRRQDVIDVQRVRGEDADQVDVAPRDDLSPVGRRERHVVLRAILFEPILVGVADAGNADRRVGQVVGEEHVRPHAQADDSGVDDGFGEWHGGSP